jgi:dTDP-4-amino-4,6-dideoxygalactose transaminase
VTETVTVRANYLPFALPSIEEEEIAEVVDTLRSGWLTTGPKVKRLESAFAEYVGARHAVALNSCTAALHLALAASGVQPGDDVLVPTLTFCSTANVVVHLQARPRLVDVGRDFNLDPHEVERVLQRSRAEGRRVSAIVPVHFGGQPCDLNALGDIARRADVPLIEDAAHAAGAAFAGRMIGTVGAATAFSFYTIKNMTTGEGGMLTTDDEQLAERVRRLSLHGMSRDAWRRYEGAGSWFSEVEEAGFKDNMSDIQAALGIHQLRRLDHFIDVRERFARLYDDAFRNVEELEIPVVHSDRTHAWHLYVLRLRTECLTINRNQFIEELRRLNIGTSVHFIPVHLHPFYVRKLGYRPGDFPVAEDLYQRIVSLPLYPRLEAQDIGYVADAVVRLVREHRIRR